MRQIFQYLDPTLAQLINEANSFHSHLGPFLVLGIRLGYEGLEALASKKGDPHVYVTMKLEYQVPISCTLDGVQTATGCTFGNKRLRLKESKDISAIFERKQKKVEIKINQNIIQYLTTRISIDKSDKENLHQIAYEIASKPSKELFLKK
jgi:formylmethanofuran dehydrogenase subunit E